MHFLLRGLPCQAIPVLAECHLLPHSALGNYLTFRNRLKNSQWKVLDSLRELKMKPLKVLVPKKEPRKEAVKVLDCESV